MLKQITVFLENDKGRLAGMAQALADAGISMTALTVADTASYGVIRILAAEPQKAQEALIAAGYRSKLVDVYAVEIPNLAGGLAKILTAFEAADINIEYAYCFASTPQTAIEIFRVEKGDQVQEIVQKVGFKLLSDSDLFN